jgi:hypothetical protein
MNDDEARYLIDQYNKYVSWDVRLREVRLAVYFGLALATAAILASLSLQLMSPEAKYLLFPTFFIVLVVFFILFVRHIGMLESTYEDHRRRLCRLEDYRFKHKLLPDSITFKLIVEESGKVEKLLDESEPLRKPKNDFSANR